MENPSDNVQSAPGTANPQQGGTANGASNAVDFQSTAPSSTLRDEVENLTVQETGEPLTGAGNLAAGDGWPLGWVITVAIMVIVALIVLVKLIKETIEEDGASVRSAPAAASARKTPAQKKSSKKKSGAGQKKKKSTAKKRR